MDKEIKKTILLVEDEALIAVEEKGILEKYGYSVVWAQSGEKAIEAVETTDGIDLILMDINLGKGILGTEAALFILERHDIPLIFLSSHTERSVVEKTEGITSYGYIVKSSGETVLIASIKMAFRLYEAKKNELEKDKILIQEREEAAQKLETERQFLFDVIDFLPGATFILDMDKRIIGWNRAAEIMTGVKRDELLGKGNYEYSIPFFGQRQPILVDFLDESPGELEKNYKYIHKAGDILHAESFIKRLNNGEGMHLWGAATRLYDQNGNCTGYIEVIRDVSDLLQAVSKHYEKGLS